MAEHFEWLPVAAPEIGGRISNGDDAFTADDMREIAGSYDLSYRPASLICGYSPGGESGSGHFAGRFLPEISSIRALRFDESSQELEAELEVTPLLRQRFAQGFRTPSVGIFKLPDHPSGEPRLYCQHVNLTGPGELEIIAGLGGERWAERLRSFNEELTEIGDGLKRYKFRSLTNEEISMADDPKAETKKKAAHEDEDEDKRSSEKKRSAQAELGLEAPRSNDEPTPKLHAVEDDPADEAQAQIRALRSDVATQNETIAALAQTVTSFVEAAGDPARVRSAAEEVEKLRDDMRTRAASDQKEHIEREVEALASGSEPRIRNAEAPFITRALLAMDPAEAATELATFRAGDPIAVGLDTLHHEDAFKDLPKGFTLGIYRNASGGPSESQIREYAELSAAGEGDAVSTVIARERSENMRREFNG